MHIINNITQLVALYITIVIINVIINTITIIFMILHVNMPMYLCRPTASIYVIIA